MPPADPNHKKTYVVSLLAITILAGLVIFWLNQDAATPKNEFSGARAMRHVEAIVAFGPRPAGSEALEKSRQYIAGELAKLGWTVERQPFTKPTKLRGNVDFVNLRARYAPGAEGIDWNMGGGMVVVASHYDTKWYEDIEFVGANDGGSSTGALIELAGVLANHYPDIAKKTELVFFDGEEAFGENITATDGLYGSHYYSRALWRLAKPEHRPAYGIVLDMGRRRGPRDHPAAQLRGRAHPALARRRRGPRLRETLRARPDRHHRRPRTAQPGGAHPGGRPDRFHLRRVAHEVRHARPPQPREPRDRRPGHGGDAAQAARVEREPSFVHFLKMKPARTSYDNIKRWKIERRFDHYAILPSPNFVFTVFLVVLPFVAFFYWLLHFNLEVENEDHLLIADLILSGTCLLLLVICLYTRFQVSRDNRPILIVKPSCRELSLPRLSKTYQLDGDEKFFVAHDYFDDGLDSAYSELNFVANRDNPSARTLLLHFLGRYRGFDKIGKELEQMGVPFQFREHRM